MTSGSSRGRPPKLTAPTAYKFKSCWTPSKSGEYIIDFAAPTVALGKRPRAVASTLVVDPNLACDAHHSCPPILRFVCDAHHSRL